MPRSSTLLTIRAEVELSEYSFSYTDWSRGASHSWVASLTAVESDALRQLLSDFSRRPQGTLVESVREIITNLLPADMLSYFESHPPEELIVLSDEACLPWEWAGRRGHPLATSYCLARDLASRPTSSPLAEGSPRRSGVPESPCFCLIGDPLTSQSGVAEDVTTAAGLLRSGPGEVVGTASNHYQGTLREALFGHRFGLVHVAAPGLVPIQVGGQALRPTDEAAAERTGPRFAFLHSFLRPEAPGQPLMEALAAWAHRLFANGVEAVLGNLWTGSPAEQRKFTRTFYSALAEGDTLGQSLLKARRMLAERGSSLAQAYCLFGNPGLRLAELRPMKVRESTTMPGGLSTDYQLRILSGCDQGRIIPLFTAALARRGLILGSAGVRPCDIELDPSLPNQAASLSLRDLTLVLKNLGSEPDGVRVNGLPVRSELALSGRESLQLGPVELQLERTSPGELETQERPQLEAFCLEIHDGQTVSTQWYEDDLVTLGRGSGARVVFSDPSVSRTHAVLQHCAGALILARLGANLVAVNGMPVEQTQTLADGDTVQLTDRAFFRVLRILGNGAARRD